MSFHILYNNFLSHMLNCCNQAHKCKFNKHLLHVMISNWPKLSLRIKWDAFWPHENKLTYLNLDHTTAFRFLDLIFAFLLSWFFFIRLNPSLKSDENILFKSSKHSLWKKSLTGWERGWRIFFWSFTVTRSSELLKILSHKKNKCCVYAHKNDLFSYKSGVIDSMKLLTL